MKWVSVILGIAAAIISVRALETVTPQHRAPASGFVRVSAVQYPIEPNSAFEKLKNKVANAVREAARRQSDLVIFPELLTMDLWTLNNGKSDREISFDVARQYTEAYFQFVTELSKRHQIAILAGSSPRVKNNEIYNTAMMVFPNGRQIFHDKVFLTEWEKEQGWKTGNELTVFDAPWGRTVILTCFDSEFPLTTQALAASAPEWILIPSMTETEAGLKRVRWSAQARAVEHHAFVVVTGTVGRYPGWEQVGQAALLEPWEKQFKGVVQEGRKNANEIVTGDYNIQALRANRAVTHLNPAKEQANRNIQVHTVH